jgi:hypothetical protein
VPQYRLLFSQGDVLDEFDAETDFAAHRRGRDASRLVDVPTQEASDTPWRRSDFRVERQDGAGGSSSQDGCSHDGPDRRRCPTLIARRPQASLLQD